MLAGHPGGELHPTIAAGVMGQLIIVTTRTKKILLVFLRTCSCRYSVTLLGRLASRVWSRIIYDLSHTCPACLHHTSILSTQQSLKYFERGYKVTHDTSPHHFSHHLHSSMTWSQNSLLSRTKQKCFNLQFQSWGRKGTVFGCLKSFQFSQDLTISCRRKSHKSKPRHE